MPWLGLADVGQHDEILPVQAEGGTAPMLKPRSRASSRVAFIVAMVLVINVLVVIYPSVVGSAGARDEKTQFAKHVLGGAQTPTTDEASLIEQIWIRPNLPFRARSGLSALTIYLVFPLLLAIASQLLGRR